MAGAGRNRAARVGVPIGRGGKRSQLCSRGSPLRLERYRERGRGGAKPGGAAPTDEWIQKMWYIYAMEYYSAIKKNEPTFTATWMDVEIIILSELSQEEKDKYHMIHLYVESKI